VIAITAHNCYDLASRAATSLMSSSRDLQALSELMGLHMDLDRGTEFMDPVTSLQHLSCSSRTLAAQRIAHSLSHSCSPQLAGLKRRLERHSAYVYISSSLHL